jgi:gentisate 1,2-dioxygenase
LDIRASEGDDSLAAYKAELDQFSVNFAAIVDQPLILPKTHKVLAHHWRGDQLEALLARSLEFQEKLPTGRAGAERRIIRLQNPGLDGETVTNTMSMSVQLLLPGEVARPHRHTPVAFRFFLKGSAYTTVNGEKCVMQPGDLVLTPYMQWHDHGNEGSEPAIWIDGLDFPLVRFLDAVIKQDTEKQKQGTNRSGTTDRRYGTVGLRPAWHANRDVERSSLIHYRWADTHRMLLQMAKAEDADPYDDVILEYVNPATGDSVFATIACCIQLIRPSIHTKSRRMTSHKVFHVFDGAGETIVDGVSIKWTKGDFFVVPSMAWHEHVNSSKTPAILFSLQDFPTLKRLGLYREETADTPAA